MKKAVLGKVKGQHKIHEKEDVNPHILRKLRFDTSEERMIMKNNMPGPGTYNADTEF